MKKRFRELLRNIGLRAAGRRIRVPFSELFLSFQQILKNNNAAMEVIADMGGKTGGEFVFDKKYLVDSVRELERLIRESAYHLNFITGNRYQDLNPVIQNLTRVLEIELSGKLAIQGARKVYALEEIEEGMEDLVGYKAFNLSKMERLPGARVPRSFVIAIVGFRDYLAYNNLFERIEELIGACREGSKSVRAVSDAIRLMLLGGEIPPDLRRAVLSAVNLICDGDPEKEYFSIRSSALGEDGPLSFAGLHDSFLNVPLSELFSSYKKVVASLYNERSLEYRLRTNLLSAEMAMPVLCQRMVQSRVSGVLYTLDPNSPEKSHGVLTCSWGLGSVVAGGDVSGDTFRISRSPPHRVLDKEVRVKARMLASHVKGPMREVPRELRNVPSVREDEAGLIMEIGLVLERYFKRPLDVEWSIDEGGDLWILQARRLRVSRAPKAIKAELKEVLDSHRVLLEGVGEIAYRGVGTGPVWIVKEERDLARFPRGGVLVSRYSPPWLAGAIPKASAIVTDIGAATGHMATVAREFRVPTLVGTQKATEVLVHGREITVDAERNVVYEGRIDVLLRRQLLEKPTFDISEEFQMLRRLLKKISPLFLTDPEAPEFTPKGCRTLHDIMRFIHQRAFDELVRIGSDARSFLKRGGKRLKSRLPLDLILIDIGGGISKDAGSGVYVDPDQITSFPMTALWQGLNSPDVWSTDPVPVDFKGLMSSLTRTSSPEVTGNRLPGVNLAVIGRDYLNLSLPLGYHFTALEASAGSSHENNYISFRFAGGVTDITRRSRRANLLMKILSKAGFKVQVNGDLVIARGVQLTREEIRARLYLLGRLIGFARQLDVLLKSDKDADAYFERFIDELGESYDGEWEQRREAGNEKDDRVYPG
ncbi:MAG: hypothetical protein JRJ16_03520 [Deltaproteobacteria bacterium]|nr:hypothetical protein [Deltaproteobacteria bacterium]